MSKKNIKHSNKKANTQKRQYEDVPTFKSPAKTLWGKIVIIIIVVAMLGAGIVGFIWALIDFFT